MYVHRQTAGERNMNNSEIMKLAHELTRRELATNAGRKFYGTYAVCFADMLRAVYAEMAYEVRMDAQYGKGMRPGFQIIEPERVWA